MAVTLAMKRNYWKPVIESLRLPKVIHSVSIDIPVDLTGVYGYPKSEAAEIASVAIEGPSAQMNF